MLTDSEYHNSVKELQTLQNQSKKFDEKALINKGYPVWVVKSQKTYYADSIRQLQSQIQEYLIKNPNPGKKSKRRFRNKNTDK